MRRPRKRSHHRSKKAADTLSAQPFFIGQEIILYIERLSYNGGRGVGRHEGLVVFCEQVAPEETVRARITMVKKSFAEAELIEVLEPSKDRRTPPCPIAHSCGGCTWQHVSYERQVKEKQAILDHAFRRLSQQNDFEFRPILASPNEFRYRNRIQLHKHQGDLGFFARKSNRIIDTDDCLIAEAELIKAFPRLRSEYTENSPRPLRLEVAKTTDGSTQIFAGKRPATAALFSQINSPQNERLIQMLLDSTKHLSPQRVYDLFCGTGNFTFPLAQTWPEADITAVDLSASSIDRAKMLAKDQPRPGAIDFLAQDVGQFLAKETSSSNSLILVDPPRAGCSNQTIEGLIRLAPETLVYISCNPMTLVRDLEKLIEKGDYRIEFVQGVDMFPQTEHIESFVLLRKA